MRCPIVMVGPTEIGQHFLYGCLKGKGMLYNNLDPMRVVPYDLLDA